MSRVNQEDYQAVVARRDQAEQRRRESERLLSITLRSIGDAVLAADTGGRVTFMNPVAEALTGWTEADARGRDAREVFVIVDERNHAPMKSPIAHVLQQGVGVDLGDRALLVARDGVERPIADSGSPIRDDDGNLVGVVLVFRDITSRRQAERRAAAQNALSLVLAEATDLPAAAQPILEAIGKHLNWEMGRLWLSDSQTDGISIHTVWHHADGPATEIETVSRHMPFTPEDSLSAHVWKSGMPAWISSAEMRVGMLPTSATDETGEGGYVRVAFPIQSDNGRTGVIEFCSHMVHAYDEQMLPALIAMGQQVGQFIERKRAKTERLRLANYLSLLMNSTGEGIYGVDVHGNCTFINQAAARMLGYMPDELLGKNMHVLIHHTYRDGSTYAQEECPIYRAYRVRQSCRIDGEVFWRRDGSAFPVEYSSFPVCEEETIHGAVVTFADITERSAAEQALQEHKERIETLNARLNRTMAESNHRIKNHLQFLASLVEMQLLNEIDLVPVSELQRLSQHIRALANIHDLLTQNTRTEADMNRLSVKAALGTLVETMQSVIGERRVRQEVEDLCLSLKQATPLIVLASELINNAIKHGGGDVEVFLSATGETARLEVRDNGQGFPPDFDPGTAANTGLDLIEIMSRWDLDGQIAYQNRPEGGACVVVTFPLLNIGSEMEVGMR